MSSLSRAARFALLLPIALGVVVGARAARGATATERFRETLTHPVKLGSARAPESRAFERRGVLLRGRYQPRARAVDATHATFAASGKPMTLDGTRYVEFPNSTSLATTDPTTGARREFLITRGIRAGYRNKITLATGAQDPSGYVSDLLLWETTDAGAPPRYVSRLLESRPEASFLFEDPRVSVLYGKAGPRFLLSGTDYSPHRAGSKDKDVMNRYVELALDASGTPKPVKVDRRGFPRFRDLSPPPGVSAVDAKNAVVSHNERGQIVVRTRMRPDFKAKDVKALAGKTTWGYGEQVFVFEDERALRGYDWSHALTDLFKPGTGGDRVRPVSARVLLTDADLREAQDDPRVIGAKGKGMGPGTQPVRVRRAGDELFLAEAKGAPERRVGVIPKRHRAAFPVADGEVKYVAFDHEIRWFGDQRAAQTYTKRHYSLSVKLFDDSLTHVDAYYADVVQPVRRYERGGASGILDLHHVYPMGRTIAERGGKPVVRVVGGASDAHTPLYEFDVMKLLAEMSTTSPRRQTGQVYVPGTR